MDALRDLILRHFPGAVVEEIRPLRDDAGIGELGATRKGAGYGVPLRVTLRDAAGARRRLVFHTERPDQFGHDRRADRVAEAVLAFDTFGRIPGHVTALDAGMIDGDALVSFGHGEPYVLTTWADGALYAEDLRRIARSGATAEDLRRVDALADFLARLHRRDELPAAAYTRAVRDLLGSGEGIFGIVDGYPADVPAAPRSRLRAIEERCLAWRWRLRDRAARACRIHGDFHPFNLLFDGDRLATLDASRGCVGEAADDLTALAVNHVFFALDRPGAWRGGLGRLWHRLWERYLDATGDREILDVAAPWLAWRALVVSCPTWYPDLPVDGRDALLGWIERVLDAPRFDPSSADGVPP
jgi:hypothetical protein